MKHFEKLLYERRMTLLQTADAGDAAAVAVELDQSRVGRLSRMDAMQAQAMSQESVRRRDLELKRISAALQRLKDGEYGDCLYCGEVIAQGRLQADPAAILCIRCATKVEQH